MNTFCWIFPLFLALACGVLFTALDTSHLQLAVTLAMSIALATITLWNVVEFKGWLNCDHGLAKPLDIEGFLVVWCWLQVNEEQGQRILTPVPDGVMGVPDSVALGT